jgi:hypothetical protein
MKEGATPIEDTHRSKGNLEGFYSNLLHSYSRAPDLQLEGVLISFGGHLLRGRNIEHFQLVRARTSSRSSLPGSYYLQI